MPASRLLSPKEKKLCAQLRLKPSQYITLKTLIIKASVIAHASHTNGNRLFSQEAYMHKKPGKAAAHKSPLDAIDGRVRRRLFTFMTRSGWLASPSATG